MEGNGSKRTLNPRSNEADVSQLARKPEIPLASAKELRMDAYMDKYFRNRRDISQSAVPSQRVRMTLDSLGILRFANETGYVAFTVKDRSADRDPNGFKEAIFEFGLKEGKIYVWQDQVVNSEFIFGVAGLVDPSKATKEQMAKNAYMVLQALGVTQLADPTGNIELVFGYNRNKKSIKIRIFPTVERAWLTAEPPLPPPAAKLRNEEYPDGIRGKEIDGIPSGTL